MRFKVYPRDIWIDVDIWNIYAIEKSMSGKTMILHVPGLQIPVTNGQEYIESDAFERDFIEMSEERWIRPSAITSMQRFGDNYVRVLLSGVRQPFDLFPSETVSLREVYTEFKQKLPAETPSFLALDVAA